MSLNELKSLIQLDLMIRDKRCPSSKAIQEQFDVSSRTAYRYISILKNRYHALIEYDPENNGYYYTKPWSIYDELQTR